LKQKKKTKTIFPPAQEAHTLCSSPAGRQEHPGKNYFPSGSALGFSTRSLIRPLTFTRALLSPYAVCACRKGKQITWKQRYKHILGQTVLAALSVCAWSWMRR